MVNSRCLLDSFFIPKHKYISHNIEVSVCFVRVAGHSTVMERDRQTDGQIDIHTDKKKYGRMDVGIKKMDGQIERQTA